MKGLHKFEKIENDVYTGGCKGIQPFEERKSFGNEQSNREFQQYCWRYAQDRF